VISARGLAAHEAGADLVPWDFERRDVGPGDVQISISHSGVCHSDIHLVRGDWGEQEFPVVPGHEIVGEVVAVGADVTNFSVGDRAGVGVYVDSCRECANCVAGQSNYCLEGMTGTYANPDRRHGGYTQGGYATTIVVDQGYVVHVPESLDPAGAAPLLCAGITLYAPLRRFEAGPGKRVGIVGLGGLGHMGVKFAVAMGADVTVISHTPEKKADAEKLGAQHFLLSTDQDAMDAERYGFDLIINTVSVPLDTNVYLELLGFHGVFVNVGLPGEPSA
jgi:Zn-dependent alcohol dehydrogenases